MTRLCNFEMANGKLMPLQGDPLDASPFNSLDGIMKRAGYEQSRSFGTFGMVTFYSAVDENPLTEQYQFVAEISPLGTDHGMTVWVKDCAEVLQLLTLIQPVVLLDVLEEKLVVFETFAQRFFRAEHGHDLEDPCQKCDPRGYQQLVKASLERRKLRTGTQG